MAANAFVDHAKVMAKGQYSSTFEERLELVRKQEYFCYSKPHIKLTIQIIED